MYGRTPMKKGMMPKRKKKQKTGGLYKGRYGMSDGGPAVKKMYGGMARKNMKHGGPHNNMDRIGMAMGGAMDVQDPN